MELENRLEKFVILEIQNCGILKIFQSEAKLKSFIFVAYAL
jgi:hypothetical protein